MVKIKAAQAEQYCRRLHPGLSAYLLFGPDQGLATERARRLVALAAGDPPDPFSIVELEPERVRQTPALLIEESQSISMLGGRRALRIRPGGDFLAKAFTPLLELADIEAVVIVEAGDLAASSRLRKLFEKSRNAIAIPCYRDEERDMAGVIRDLSREYELRLEPDASDYLRGHLGADREITRRQIEKLALIAMDSPQTALSLETVAKTVGDHSALLIDDWTLSILCGEAQRAGILLKRLLAQGDNPVRLLRALLSQTKRTLGMRLAMRGGEKAANVIPKARPPVHFRHKASIDRILNRHTAETLSHIIGAIATTERLCKSAGSPAPLLMNALTSQVTRSPVPQTRRV